MALSPDAKERLGVVFDVVKTAFHWGFIPAVLYLGNYPKYIHFAITHKSNLKNFSIQDSKKDLNMVIHH